MKQTSQGVGKCGKDEEKNEKESEIEVGKEIQAENERKVKR
jgi:hypothetical protein